MLLFADGIKTKD